MVKKTKRKAPTRKKVAKKKAAKKRASKKRPAKKKAAKKASKKKVSRKTSPKKTRPAEPVELTKKAEWSISQFWLNTGFARETVRKRFAEAGLKASRTVKGYPVYLAADGLPVLFYTQDGELDPDKLKPFERRAYYQSELEKLKLQQEKGELVPSFEVENQLAKLCKIVVRGLDTLPDTIERDVGASSTQLALIEKLLDELRAQMYTELVSDEDADSATEIGA